MAAEELFDGVVAALRGEEGVTLSKMFGAPGLKVSGKAFAMLYRGQFVVKLPQARVEALAAAGAGERFDLGMGRQMREWLAVEPRDGGEWLGLAKEARAFVAAGRAPT